MELNEILGKIIISEIVELLDLIIDKTDLNKDDEVYYKLKDIKSYLKEE